MHLLEQEEKNLKKICNVFKLKPNEVCLVGDQIFTDVLGGRLVGVRTILLTPIKLETSLRFRSKRRVERFVMKKLNIVNTEE